MSAVTLPPNELRPGFRFRHFIATTTETLEVVKVQGAYVWCIPLARCGRVIEADEPEVVFGPWLVFERDSLAAKIGMDWRLDGYRAAENMPDSHPSDTELVKKYLVVPTWDPSGRMVWPARARVPLGETSPIARLHYENCLCAAEGSSEPELAVSGR